MSTGKLSLGNRKVGNVGLCDNIDRMNKVFEEGIDDSVVTTGNRKERA